MDPAKPAPSKQQHKNNLEIHKLSSFPLLCPLKMNSKRFENMEEKFRKYEKNPSSHPEYFKERKIFMSSTINKNKFSHNEMEREFNKHWDNYLDNERNQELERNKRRLWNREEKYSDSDSSSWSSDEQERNSDFEERYLAARKLLKAKYRRFYEMPETHDDYPYYLERFRRNNEERNLKDATRKNKWRDYWNEKMDVAFENECKKVKEIIFKLIKEEQKKPCEKRSKVKQEVVKVKIEGKQAPEATLLVRVKTEPTEPQQQRYQIPQLFPEIITIKDEPMDDEEEEKIPKSKVERMLENYDLRVHHVTAYVQELFDGYLIDSKSYPKIEDEKKKFLKQQRAAKESYEENDILQFEEKFLEYWPKQVEILFEQQMKIQMKKIRTGWIELVRDPADICYEDRSFKRRSSSCDESLEKRQNIKEIPSKSKKWVEIYK